MKRKALLIGAGKQEEIGVKSDLDNYSSFLKSYNGGSYYDNEIIYLLNESKDCIMNTIHNIKKENNDIVFSVFTGHGYYDDIYRNERVLQIDDKNNIYESDLLNLSDKQILIIDACAGLASKEIKKQASYINFAQDIYLNSDYRSIYEKEVAKCPGQLIRLYSSYRGELSSPEENVNMGGMYSYNLIEVLKNNRQSKLDIVSAHNEASQRVIQRTQGQQNPSRLVPKINISEYLPGSIN